MSDALNANLNLSVKIARLVEEKGWNQEDFANISGLNRQTVRQILQPNGDRSLRNSTVAACARALGVPVHELRALSLERLLARISRPSLFNGDEGGSRLLDLATNPELRAWIERNPQRSRELRPEEIEELLKLQEGQMLTSLGVDSVVAKMERRRILFDQVRAIANTEYLDALEVIVDLMYDRIQPRGS